MFLRPTAKPVPRRTPSPRVVLPVPPGRRTGSRGSSSGSGGARSAQRRMTSATGSEPVISWPVGSVSPGLRALSSRSSTGIDVERGRELVHLRLVREAALNGAEAAHGAARRVVRVDAGAFDEDVLDAVRAGSEAAGVREHRRRARGVRAAVEEDARVDGDEPSVARRAVLRPDLRRMAMDVAREGLLTVVDHLHGPPRVEREQGGVDLDREVLAAAEGAADAGEVDPHLLGSEREAGRDLVAVDVDPLGGDVDVDASLSVRDGEAGLGAEECLVLGADLVDAADRDVALDVWVAVPDDHRADDVGARVVAEAVAGGRPVRMQRLLLRRSLGIGNRWQLLVRDLDRGRRRGVPARGCRRRRPPRALRE